MRIERRYTKEGQSAYEGIEFRLTTSEIRNPDGSVVFRAEAVEVIERSKLLLARRYRAQLRQRLRPAPGPGEDSP